MNEQKKNRLCKLNNRRWLSLVKLVSRDVVNGFIIRLKLQYLYTSDFNIQIFFNYHLWWIENNWMLEHKDNVCTWFACSKQRLTSVTPQFHQIRCNRGNMMYSHRENLGSSFLKRHWNMITLSNALKRRKKNYISLPAKQTNLFGF